MPVFIASNPEFEKKFREKNIPIIGDDIKSQLGATITHRVLTKLFSDRGVKLDRTYQLNTGGNSVTGDQEILLSIDNEMKKVNIGEFIDSYLDVYGEKRLDGKDIVVLNKTSQNIKCFTVDGNYNVVLSDVDALIRHEISEPVYEVTTEEGRKIKITGDHNVFTLDENGTLNEIPVKQLRENETYIAVPRVLPFTELKHVKEIDLTPYQDNLFVHGISNGFLNVHSKPEIKIPVKFPVTDELLQLVGLWLADGNFDRAGSSNIELACGHEPECMELVDELTGSFNIGYNIRNDGIRVRVLSKTLGKIFKLAFGLKGNAYTKRVPGWVFNLSDSQIALVLKGYVSGDGGVTGKQIRWTSVSKGLLNDMQTLFLRLGINSSIFKEKYADKRTGYNSALKYAWHGLISSKEDIELFKNKVSFVQDYKNKALDAVSNKLKKFANHRIPNIKLFKKWKIKSTTWRKHGSVRAYIVLSQLEKVKDYFERERIKQICSAGVRFVKIKKVKRINLNSTYVYDLSTKPFERFICSNLLVHNTDFLNMLERKRLKSKKISKTESVQSQLPQRMDADNIHIGPSDYVPWQKDNKVCFIRMEGRKFGDVPLELELRLSVQDSPNSAGITIDALRAIKVAKDRNIGGELTSCSSYFMKHPLHQFPDSVAKTMVEEFIKGERER
ncbi:MAG: LAGLIDADG family homing endonuclease [archaeon]